MSNNATAVKPIDKLKAMLNADSIRTQFEGTLQENTNQFIASLLEIYSGDAKLQLCDAADIVRVALKAATLHLPINKELGFAYIAAYNTTVKNADGSFTKKYMPTFLVGYKGYYQLAHRTRQYHIINADVVYEGEMKCRNKLTGLIEFNDTRTSDKVVGYFCYISLIAGFEAMVYMTVEEMARYAKRWGNVSPKTTVSQLIELANKEADGKGIGWEGNFTDMALKTVTRRLLSKKGYLSTEMQEALEDEMKYGNGEAERDEAIAAEEVKVIDIEPVAAVASPEEKKAVEQAPLEKGKGDLFDENDMPY